RGVVGKLQAERDPVRVNVDLRIAAQRERRRAELPEQRVAGERNGQVELRALNVRSLTGEYGPPEVAAHVDLDPALPFDVELVRVERDRFDVPLRRVVLQARWGMPSAHTGSPAPRSPAGWLRGGCETCLRCRRRGTGAWRWACGLQFEGSVTLPERGND